MVRRILLAAVLAILLAWGGLFPALAARPELGPGEHWLVLAARQDRTDAIDFARTYARDLTGVRVVRADNGWFAIIAGPTAMKTMADARAYHADRTSLPEDAYLASAKGFGDDVFEAPAPAARAFGRLEGNGSVTVNHAGITVVMASTPDKEDLRIPTFVARAGGTELFRLEIPDASADTPRSNVQFAQLDPATKAPQIILSSFSGGPHCCTTTRIATKQADGSWKILDAGTTDGIGYALEDVDGDGFVELIDVDNAFLYAFSSYAGSVAPPKLYQVANGAFTDVTRQKSMRDYIRRALREIEETAKGDPSAWNMNGFLAGWVATRILAGETEDAWKRMLAHYDRSMTFEGDTCVMGDQLGKCPAARRNRLPFPEALVVLLVERGYLASPKDVAGFTAGAGRP